MEEEDKESTTLIVADDASEAKCDVSPVVEGEPLVEMISDGDEILRAIHSDTVAEQQSTLAVSEDPNSTVETLKYFDALTNIQDIDFSDLPVVYAYEVGNEESKRLALQKQQEYYEKLDEQRASFLASTKMKRGRPSKSLTPQAPTSTSKTQMVAKKPRLSVTAKLENARASLSTHASSARTREQDTYSPDDASIASRVKYPIREPAPEDCLAGREGWIRETHKRKNNPRHFDRYWFSPKTNKKLRSVPELKKFLELLDSANGDENAAFAKMKR